MDDDEDEDGPLMSTPAASSSIARRARGVNKKDR